MNNTLLDKICLDPAILFIILFILIIAQFIFIFYILGDPQDYVIAS